MNDTIEKLKILKKTKMQLYVEMCNEILTNINNDSKIIYLALEIIKRSRERTPDLCLLINKSKYFECYNNNKGKWLINNNKNSIYNMALDHINKKKRYNKI